MRLATWLISAQQQFSVMGVDVTVCMGHPRLHQLELNLELSNITASLGNTTRHEQYGLWYNYAGPCTEQ